MSDSSVCLVWLWGTGSSAASSRRAVAGLPTVTLSAHCLLGALSLQPEDQLPTVCECPTRPRVCVKTRVCAAHTNDGRDPEALPLWKKISIFIFSPENADRMKNTPINLQKRCLCLSCLCNSARRYHKPRHYRLRNCDYGTVSCVTNRWFRCI